MAETSKSLEAAANIVGGLAGLGMNMTARTDSPTPGVSSVLSALREFDACVRYLNTRRSAGAIINIQSEADVQDVLYLLLRPWIVDLVYESPADKSGNRYAIKDFSSAAVRLVLDAKYIRDKEHGRSISKELHDDIEMYRSHPDCDDIIFFVYDPDAVIPDQRALREQIEVERSYGGTDAKRLRCHLIVKP
jgi:hypothetical protein